MYGTRLRLLVVRGGSLSVSLSSWSIESFLLIATAVGYGIRWIAAKQKYVLTCDTSDRLTT